MTRTVVVALSALLFATAADAGTVPAPAGAAVFCLRNPSFCETHPSASASLADKNTVIAINAQVNKEILPEPLNTDAEKRGENNNWRTVMPGGLGACVEFALTKEQLLASAGIPMGAMHLAQVRVPETGELHMVLLVRIGGVLNVLDNLSPAIWGPDRTHYEFLAIQNGTDWIAPGDLK